MHGRAALLTLGLGLLASLPAAQDAAPAAVERPNFIVLLADDLGLGDLSTYGGWIPAPRIDALASSGVRFTQAYATAPVCTPSRAGLLAGRNQVEFGVQCNTGTNAQALKKETGMPGEVVTVAERLRALGYRTGCVGKWHLGMLNGMRPRDQGFEDFYGFLGASHTYLPTHEEKIVRGNSAKDTEPEKEYLTEAWAREVIAYTAAHESEPFFLYMPFNAPHIPYEATPKYLERFPALDKPRRIYAAMVSAMDDAVGRILDALEEQGLAKRTLVLFLSDNGADTIDGPGSNAPYKEGKGFLFEGGIRMPMLMRWPGHVEAGKVCDAPVSFLDVAPTLLALAGGGAEALDGLEGKDLLATLAASPAPARTLYWKLGPSAAIREGDWKLVASKGSRWLFDLGQDPREEVDLVDAQPAKLAELGAELQAWIDKQPPAAWANEKLDTPMTVLNKSYWIEF